ncbi:MAG: glycosyltransferase [Planctomycetota bacterium]
MRSHTIQQPLRTIFLTTSMPVGGAEVLLANLVRGFNRERILPEICCLKEPGPLGDELAAEIPVHSRMIHAKYDFGVLLRLYRLFRQQRVDAIVTVGAGDKMFWGRLAAKLAGVQVIASALHSTGWPDSVGKLNRFLTPITDAFIGVADAHARHLVAGEGFPADRVHTIYNGVDTDRFSPQNGDEVRRELGIPRDANVVGIIAALRPEKNHELLLKGAARIIAERPNSRFLIVGDGPMREPLEGLAAELGIAENVLFTGSRPDIAQLLSAVDVFALTSHNEASPVSILEAMASGVPVVASDVGSVSESVTHESSGFLFEPGDIDAFSASVLRLLQEPDLRARFGRAGRESVESRASLAAMIRGYEDLLCGLASRKGRPKAAIGVELSGFPAS